MPVSEDFNVDSHFCIQ